MSLCAPCTSFGLWLDSKSTGDYIRSSSRRRLTNVEEEWRKKFPDGDSDSDGSLSPNETEESSNGQSKDMFRDETNRTTFIPIPASEPIRFLHHAEITDLLQAPASGCSLCSLLVELRAAGSETSVHETSPGDSTPSFFQVFPEKKQLYHGLASGGNRIQLEVYSKDVTSDIWMNSDHGLSTPLSAATLMNGWLEECSLNHTECNAQNSSIPTRLWMLGHLMGVKSPELSR